MFYYIYKTTNTISGKYYIGMHQHETEFDRRYIGSGVSLAAAIKKHGRDVFTCEVLEYCSTREEMFEREKALVTEAIVRSTNTYNQNVGGRGGTIKGSRLMKDPATGEQRRFAPGEDSTGWVGIRSGMPADPAQRAAVAHSNATRGYKDSTREKMRATKVGKKWYNNGIEQTYATTCPAGYAAGMLKRSKAV